MVEVLIAVPLFAVVALGAWYWRERRSDRAVEGAEPHVGPLLDDGDLPAALRSLDRNLQSIGYRMDRKFVRNLTVMFAGLVLAVVAVTVAVSSSRDADQANHALSVFKQAQTAARVGSCQQYNRRQTDSITKDIALSHDLVAALAVGIPDPVERQRQVDAYNKTHDALIVAKTPPRDCSPEGIARYLKGVPATTVP